MVDVDKAVIARLKIGGTNLEVLVDPELALEFKQGKDVDLNEMLASEKIFFDAKKGQLASESRIKEIFETDDMLEAVKRIVKKGDVQVTAEHKNKELEEKKKNIMHKIHINAIDPKTGSPHPMSRLELAFDEAKIKIDVHKSADQQMQDIIKKLRTVMPIKIESVEVQLIFPPEYAQKSYPTVKEFGSIKNEEWRKDGSWMCYIEMPAGLKNDLVDKVNSVTKGEALIRFKE